MGVILVASNNQALSPMDRPVFAATLLAMLHHLGKRRSPGLSLNPAYARVGILRRRVGLQFGCTHCPACGDILAGQLYRISAGRDSVYCAKLHHENSKRCIFRCNYGELNASAEITTMSSSSAPELAAERLPKARADGQKHLVMERGGYVPREKENWSTRAVNIEGPLSDERALARP